MKSRPCLVAHIVLALCLALMPSASLAADDGLRQPGNEDCGQMSAWFVSSALGLYQVEPCGGRYQFGSPLVKRASFTTAAGKTFTIVAHNNSSQNLYIRKVKLNGKPYKKDYIYFSDIQRGGTLEFFMDRQPSHTR